MNWDRVTIGWGVTGAHHLIESAAAPILRCVQAGARVIPIVSESVRDWETSAGRGSDWLDRLAAWTGERPLTSVVAAEPLGPLHTLDILVVSPCTGTTLAKMANGIFDTPVLTAVKALLRNRQPVVLAVASNDLLGINAHNLARLLNTRNVYFVPMGQDTPQEKPTSLTAHWNLTETTLEAALDGRQLQPLFLPW